MWRGGGGGGGPALGELGYFFNSLFLLVPFDMILVLPPSLTYFSEKKGGLV